uniref:Annexin n=1 Tax=Aegilops tauschii subsp. strangulata TaxID=200361 RepID=A0A452XVX8_AEGTS
MQILLAYLGVPRNEGPEVDPSAVTNDARELYRAGEKRVGTDERAFIRIFTESSRAHLVSIANAYQHMYARSLEKVMLVSNFLETPLIFLPCANQAQKINK